MFAGLNGWHLVILLVVILLLFGAAKLPALAEASDTGAISKSARVRMVPAGVVSMRRGAVVISSIEPLRSTG